MNKTQPAGSPAYIDLHTHILPGVDDGAADLEETGEMLKAAHREGIRTVVATPHFLPGRSNISPARLGALAGRVRELMENQYPDMRLFLGNEIYYNSAAIKALREKEALTLGNTDFCLVEFNIMGPFGEIFQAVRELTAAGYRPVIAHVERYRCLYKKENLLDQLLEAGAYTQMNSDNIKPGLFDRHSAYCIQLIRSGRIHLLGSDCHRAQTRKPLMEQAVQILSKKLDSRTIARITAENAARILANQYIK